MLFAFMFASTLAVSAVLGRSSGPTPTQLTYMKEEQIQGQIEETGQILAVGDRSSNLRYVMAIQSSSIWTDIKQRSLTINSTQRLDEAVAEKSPNDLSDEELEQLKRACHDGLKCVAVDQLLVLKKVREPLNDGNTLLRMIITKITRVITQYPAEYHEDVYQYEAVTQSDDPSKVYESVTNIVEDNKELCQIDVSATDTQEKNTADFQKTFDGQTRPLAAVVIDNNNTVNYDTIENYNINNGTVNSATITKEPSDKISIVESPEPGPEGRPDTSRMVIVIAPRAEPADDGNTKSLSPSGLPEKRDDTDTSTVAADDGGHKRVRQQRPRNSGTSANRPSVPVSTADDDRRTSAGRPDTASNGSGANNNGGGRRTARSRAVGSSADANRSVQKNNAIVKNGGRNTDSEADVVNAGSDDRASLRKGYVSNGTLNNDNMVEYDINNGTINTGRIDESTADRGGIISVGTVNNGPVNYGTSNKHTNNGNRATGHGDDDMQKYLSSIDKMYSTILEKLS